MEHKSAALDAFSKLYVPATGWFDADDFMSSEEILQEMQRVDADVFLKKISAGMKVVDGELVEQFKWTVPAAELYTWLWEQNYQQEPLDRLRMVWLLKRREHAVH